MINYIRRKGGKDSAKITSLGKVVVFCPPDSGGRFAGLGRCF